MGLRKSFKKATKGVSKITRKAVTVVKKNPALAIAAGGLALGGFAALPMLSKALPMVGGIFGGGGGKQEEAEVVQEQEVQEQRTAMMYPNSPQAAQVQVRTRRGFWAKLFG